MYTSAALSVRVGLIPHTVPHRDGFLHILQHILELVDLQTMWLSHPSFTNHCFKGMTSSKMSQPLQCNCWSFVLELPQDAPSESAPSESIASDMI